MIGYPRAMMTLQLRNPHSILAAMQQRPEDVLDVRLPSGGGTDAWLEVEGLAASLGVNVRTGGRDKRDKPPSKQRGRQQANRSVNCLPMWSRTSLHSGWRSIVCKIHTMWARSCAAPPFSACAA